MKQLLTLLCTLLMVACENPQQEFFPPKGAKEVNPDTRLVINFRSEPMIGSSGMIRIHEAETDRVIDSLDLSIPAGPTERSKHPKAPYTWEPYNYDQPRRTNADTKPGTPSGVAGPTSDAYQLTIIGSFTDGFHFYPIIVTDTKAEIYPHHNLLQYDTEYYVTIDDGVLTTHDKSFRGISKADGWSFKTKRTAPAAHKRVLIVASDGSGDFNTLQGAMDFIPDHSSEQYTVYVQNGDYEELVYFRNKRNVTIEGESRDGVYIHYPNNEVFNPHPVDVATNEWPGTFPSRRAAFMIDNCQDITLRNLTIATTLRGQAEGLLINGERIFLEEVTINGSGDALQANGSCYFYRCKIKGDGDTILGRGPCYFDRCKIISRGPFMWIRNTEANHGNIFFHCRFKGLGGAPVLARTSEKYPSAKTSEAVLIECQLEDVAPEGWAGLPKDCSRVRYWEYNSRDTEDNPIDMSQRAAGSRRLDPAHDREWIRYYSDPSNILYGWNPRHVLPK